MNRGRRSWRNSRDGLAVTRALDLKVARLAHNPRHLDSITDFAGYASVLAELSPDA